VTELKKWTDELK